MKPSEVMLRSETNWTRSSFPLVTTTLKKGRRKVREDLAPEAFGITVHVFGVRLTLVLCPRRTSQSAASCPSPRR